MSSDNEKNIVLPYFGGLRDARRVAEIDARRRVEMLEGSAAYIEADRDIDFITAMITSVRCVSTNPAHMIAWAVLIGLMLLFSILTGLLALFVVLPVLGHASWHLYRRLIVV